MSRVKALGVAVLYGTCSTIMAFINKLVLNTFSFNLPIFMVACQMLFSIVVLECLRLGKAVSLPAYSLERGRVLALTALSGMNIPMYGVIKRCSPLAILLLGPLLLKRGPPSPRLIAAISFLTVGCLIAGFGDLAFDVRAYTYGAASVFTQAIYLVLIQKRAQQVHVNQSATETLHLNSFNTFPLLFTASLISGEASSALTYFAHDATMAFWLALFTVISLGVLLNFSLFLCTSVNSALTTAVVGTLKSIAQTAIGLFTFGGISLNVFSATGILMNLVGGILYSWIKIAESTAAASKTQSNGDVHHHGSSGEDEQQQQRTQNV